MPTLIAWAPVTYESVAFWFQASLMSSKDARFDIAA
jgi:hypothetical protein